MFKLKNNIWTKRQQKKNQSKRSNVTRLIDNCTGLIVCLCVKKNDSLTRDFVIVVGRKVFGICCGCCCCSANETEINLCVWFCVQLSHFNTLSLSSWPQTVLRNESEKAVSKFERYYESNTIFFVLFCFVCFILAFR